MKRGERESRRRQTDEILEDGVRERETLRLVGPIELVEQEAPVENVPGGPRRPVGLDETEHAQMIEAAVTRGGRVDELDAPFAAARRERLLFDPAPDGRRELVGLERQGVLVGRAPERLNRRDDGGARAQMTLARIVVRRRRRLMRVQERNERRESDAERQRGVRERRERV